MKLTATFIRAIIFACFSKYTLSHANEVFISLKNDNELSFFKTKTETYNFGITINGYNVNCKGNKIIIWGHPIHTVGDNPQATTLTLFNIENKKTIKTIKTIHFSKGVFEVDFLLSNKAYIGSGLGYFINTSTGKVSTIDQAFDPNDKRIYEECKKNKSWLFNRYGEQVQP